MLHRADERPITELHVSDPRRPPFAVRLTADRMRIGRAIHNEIEVTDPMVSSGSHCAFVRNGNEVWLVPFNAANGQSVNGVSCEERTLLRVGDVVRIGRDVTIVCVHAPVLSVSTPDPAGES